MKNGGFERCGKFQVPDTYLLQCQTEVIDRVNCIKCTQPETSCIIAEQSGPESEVLQRFFILQQRALNESKDTTAASADSETYVF